MSAPCNENAPSWLTLELYQLGELADADRAGVEQHLENCPVCRDCLDLIRADRGRALAPLPKIRPKPRPRPQLSWAIAAAAAAACAALLVVLALPHDRNGIGPGPAHAPSRIAYKGGELAVALVRERGGETLNDPKTFMPGDRFKVLVTCPPDERLFWELAVFQNGAPAFPLEPSGRLKCGNRRPLPGAFRITGHTPAAVCLLTAGRPIRRAEIAADPAKFQKNTVCLSIMPAF